MLRRSRCVPPLVYINVAFFMLLLTLIRSSRAFQILPVRSLQRPRCFSSPARTAVRCLAAASSSNPTHSATSTTAASDDIITAQTLQWVKRVVVGLHLCPFASPPLLAGHVHVRVVRGSAWDTALHAAMTELEAQSPHGTTLVVCPDLYPDTFTSFWTQVVQPIETGDWLVTHGWEGIFQVAPFHPHFTFGGNEATSPDNYTNRSPYPMLHILRESDVTRAVEELRETLPNDTASTDESDESNDPSYAIWSRNVDLLQTLHAELTPDEFQTVVTGRTGGTAALRAKIRTLLQRFR